MKVGVFDSGVGGLSVANAIKKSLPELEIALKEDKEHVPYGTRTPSEILKFVTPILQSLVNEGSDAIVIACNTVSTNLMPALRDTFSVPLVAVEPMVKRAAALSHSNIITVCATPTTLASPRYAYLKQRYARNVRIIEPDCSDWAYMIEHNHVEQDKIRLRVEASLAAGADVIVLGCTHYHWIEKEIKAIAQARAQVLQPEPVVISQLRQLLGLHA